MTTANDPDRLLEPSEAAHFLGITPELLFAYVRYAPKVTLGHSRRLTAVQNDGRTLFRRDDLTAFDAYLREPWSTDAQNRPPIPEYIVQYLRTECGGQCPRCGRGFKLENAHIDDYANSLSHHHHNLIRLCSLCHEEFDTKRILPPGEISALKEKLVAQTRERIVRSMRISPQFGSAPPTPAPIFVGRNSELRLVVEALSNKRTVCIRGPGGIGKTQLALNALAQLSDNPRVVWLDMEAFGTTTDLELSLRSALASTGGIRLVPSLAEVLEAEVDLLVFDGVEAITPARLEELEDFLSQQISRTRSTRFLVTSQAELLSVDIDFSIELRPLGEAASADLISAVAGPLPQTSNEDDTSAIVWLLTFSDGHPLTLKIIGGLLRYFRSAHVVVERIDKFGVKALSNPTRQRQTKATSLEMCLAAAYSALQGDGRHVLFVLSHCPAGCLSAMLERADTYGVSDAQAVVAELGRWHLVYKESVAPKVSRLRSLSPVRTFAQRAFEEEDAESAASLFRKLAEDLAMQAAVLDSLYTEGENVGDGMVRFGQEFANFSHVFDESLRRSKNDSSYLKPIWMLATSLQVFCFLAGLSRRGIEIMSAGATAAVQSGAPNVASKLLLQLIVLARRAGDQAEARRALQQICKLAQGSSDLDLTGNAEMACGFMAKDEGRLDEAERCFIAASAHYEQPRPARTDHVYDDNAQDDGANERMLAMSLMEQASIYEHSRRPADALRVYSKSLSLMRRTGDNVNYGSVLHQMGNCYSDLGQNDEAYRAYVEAGTRFGEICASVHLGNSLSELGYLLIDYVPKSPVERDLSPELLESGLADVFEECASVFDPELDSLPGQDCVRMVRKVFGVAALVSFSRHNYLLEDFASNLRERVVRPLASQMNRGERHKAADGVPLMYLDVTSALIGSLSVPDLLAADGATAGMDEIEHLARLCYQQYDWAWKAFRLFDWLAAYLSRCRGIPGVTALMLQGAAEEMAEKGAPFSLPGFVRR